MSVPAETMDHVGRPLTSRFRASLILAVVCLAFIALSDHLPPWAVTPPEALTSSIPLPYFSAGEGFLPTLSIVPSTIADWFNAIVQSMRRHEIFGLSTVRDVTGAIGNWIVAPLKFSESLLISGFRGTGIPPIP